jgi:hypothetical protein
MTVTVATPDIISVVPIETPIETPVNAPDIISVSAQSIAAIDVTAASQSVDITTQEPLSFAVSINEPAPIDITVSLSGGGGGTTSSNSYFPGGWT